MKKNLFYLFALICSVSLFTACSDDDGNGSDKPVSPYVGTYKFAEYTTTTVTTEDGKKKENVPVAGALHFDWKLNGSDLFVTNMVPIIKYAGGSILPSVLGTITLDEKGDVLADYIAKPQVNMDIQKIMGIFIGFGQYPTKQEVVSAFPTSGFVTSPAGLASWSENAGVLTLKLNISKIIAEAMGDGAADMENLINSLLDSKPADLKQLLAGMFPGLAAVQEKTIEQLQGWAKNGIPMQLKVTEEGHTLIYLDKAALHNIMVMHETGNKDDFGDPEMKNDFMLVWEALSAAGIIPQEAQAASAMFTVIGAYWDKTVDFNLGLNLVK